MDFILGLLILICVLAGAFLILRRIFRTIRRMLENTPLATRYPNAFKPSPQASGTRRTPRTKNCAMLQIYDTDFQTKDGEYHDSIPIYISGSEKLIKALTVIKNGEKQVDPGFITVLIYDLQKSISGHDTKTQPEADVPQTITDYVKQLTEEAFEL